MYFVVKYVFLCFVVRNYTCHTFEQIRAIHFCNQAILHIGYFPLNNQDRLLMGIAIYLKIIYMYNRNQIILIEKKLSLLSQKKKRKPRNPWWKSPSPPKSPSPSWCPPRRQTLPRPPPSSPTTSPPSWDAGAWRSSTASTESRRALMGWSTGQEIREPVREIYYPLTNYIYQLLISILIYFVILFVVWECKYFWV